MQEVPKGADRTPQKCWYFWTCDIHRVVTMLVDQCYQTQANLQVRAMAERAESTVLKKSASLPPPPSTLHCCCIAVGGPLDRDDRW